MGGNAALLVVMLRSGIASGCGGMRRRDETIKCAQSWIKAILQRHGRATEMVMNASNIVSEVAIIGLGQFFQPQATKAIEAIGTDDEAPKVMEQMRKMPINDFFAKNGKIRIDGRMVHDMYLFEVKKPEEPRASGTSTS
jgi:hypothetical protein